VLLETLRIMFIQEKVAVSSEGEKEKYCEGERKQFQA
jgi:hypothetical protein